MADPSARSERQSERASKREEKLIARFAAREPPPWVSAFRGPFEDSTVQRSDVLEQFLAFDIKTLMLSWAEQYMDGQASNLVIPVIRFDEERRRDAHYAVLVGDPSDAARLARENPAKDPGQFLVPAKGIAIEPEPGPWREQRTHFAGAFLPEQHLAPTFPSLEEGTSELLDRWGSLGSVELRGELHHFTLDMFLRCMLRVRGLLPPTPDESEQVRAAFNLEALRLDPKELLATIGVGTEFAQKVLEWPTASGALLESTLALEEDVDRVSHMYNFLVAGHDTTAHTLEWVLLELARHPEVQEACRAEADSLFAQVAAEGRSVCYNDLARLETITRVITETFRLWGPAFAVFYRKLTSEMEFRGRDGPVTVPEGTCATFWFFGHHHSPRLWGEDAGEFRPLSRDFTAEELQRGSARTPASERYHPFSLPGRDCLGKNFSLMEQRLFIARLVERFHVELEEPWRSQVADLRSGRGPLFAELAAVPGTIKPPKHLRISCVSRRVTSRL